MARKWQPWTTLIFSRTGVVPSNLRWFLPLLNSHSAVFAMASSELTWINVVISLAFVLFDIGISSVFRLGIGVSLLIAGLRCVGQLALVATVLHGVFETKNPWLVSLICCAFVCSNRHTSGLSYVVCSHIEFLGYFWDGYVILVCFVWQADLLSAVMNKSSKRFHHMVHQPFFRMQCAPYVVTKVPYCVDCNAWFNYPTLNHRYQVRDVRYPILGSPSIQ